MKEWDYRLLGMAVGALLFMCFTGCEWKENELSHEFRAIYALESQVSLLTEGFSSLSEQIAELEKEKSDSDYINELQRDMNARLDNMIVVYDPNAPEYGFLEPVEPNWVRDFGDSERIRHIYNTSKIRAMVLRDQKITAILAQRLIALEDLHKDPNDPNEVKE